jgi:hypothetical protein
MTTNPLSNTMHYSGMTGNLMMQLEPDRTHLSGQILEDYPDLMICTQKEPIQLCVNFKHSGKPVKGNSIEWSNLVFKSSNEIIIEKSCLQSFNDLKVSFPESVIYAEISFCNKIDRLDIKTFSNPKGKELARIIEESSKKEKIPDLTCSIPVKNNTVQSSGKIKITANNNSFDCLVIESKNKEGIQIESICYITEKAKADFDINRKICESNKKNIFPPFLQSSSGDPFRDNNIFKPGCYYEIEVQTKLEGEVVPSRIADSLFKNTIADLYRQSLHDLDTHWTSYSYFQTESPPQNLNPYIKWSLPLNREYNIYVKDPIQIRFKRGYIKTLFVNSNFAEHKIKVYLKDTDGNFTPVPDVNLNWLSAESSTLFQDEETWHNHLSENQILNVFKKDDILNINMNGIDVYKSSSRYELYLIGMKRPDIANDEQAKNKNVLKLDEVFFNVLSSITFTTSRFGSFDQLIKSGISESNKIIPKVLSANEINFNAADFQNLANDYVNAESEYYKTLVDYEYGMAKASKDQAVLVSKEAAEHRKLELRNQSDRINEEFRRIALALNQEILFSDIEGKLTVYALVNADKNIDFIWIKLPEPLKLKMNNIMSGKFICSLLFESQPVNSRIFNSDTSQLIFKLSRSISSNDLNKLKLSVSYIKNFNDDLNPNIFAGIQNNHHRYDRPSFKGLNLGSVEGVDVETVEIGIE